VVHRYPNLSARFFAALFALVVGLLVLALVAFHGLDHVQGANDQVYSDNYLTAQATSRLAVDIGRAEVLTLRLATASSNAEAAGLQVELDEIAIPRVNSAMSRLLRLHRGDPVPEQRSIARIPAAWNRFLALIRHGILVAGAEPASNNQSSQAKAAVVAALDPLVRSIDSRRSIETTAAETAHSDAVGVFRGSSRWLLIVAAIALLIAIGMVRIGLQLRGLVSRQTAEQQYGDAEGEYIETMQVTAHEDEAQELLTRHLERSLPAARAIVLARNNSADRLEPKTPLDKFDALREPLAGAAPNSCLAVRFARPHLDGESCKPLMSCQICGALPGLSTCEPLLVGGEVIGSVLVNQPLMPSPQNRRRMRDAVSQAAPVLANLRNLALAEFRASTDALTGLPNQRAVQDTLKRMVAQATRTMSPLAALLLDLDHFKKINDLHGHDRGDEVLAAVGVTLKNIARGSDFVGRYGGEEFLLLLPATDQEGALHLAEASRQAIAAITIPNLDSTITASVGVALLPDDAGDAVTLFRAADRALYSAKRNGRNQVQAASTQAPSPEEQAPPELAA
jgi:diguanylate cyclase (GGDEF)-like protein